METLFIPWTTYMTAESLFVHRQSKDCDHKQPIHRPNHLCDHEQPIRPPDHLCDHKWPIRPHDHLYPPLPEFEWNMLLLFTIGIAGLMLGIIIAAAGFIYYKSKATGL
ncbi:hypothetical protein QQF64_018696 [Cirrhinus molitorella]|uniref:Uncharacterized protein n=1 Tax=Cirrhinus molitorella TaxID=172907 RepID=A0ABR3LEY2_9TELE